MVVAAEGLDEQRRKGERGAVVQWHNYSSMAGSSGLGWFGSWLRVWHHKRDEEEQRSTAMAGEWWSRSATMAFIASS